MFTPNDPTLLEIKKIMEEQEKQLDEQEVPTTEFKVGDKVKYVRKGIMARVQHPSHAGTVIDVVGNDLVVKFKNIGGLSDAPTFTRKDSKEKFVKVSIKEEKGTLRTFKVTYDYYKADGNTNVKKTYSVKARTDGQAQQMFLNSFKDFAKENNIDMRNLNIQKVEEV